MSSFPKEFLFAAASSAYQIEGAWNADGKISTMNISYERNNYTIGYLIEQFLNTGKGENIWDRITHTKPDMVENRENGDIACDSYHLYKEDVKLLKDAGVSRHKVASGSIALELESNCMGKREFLAMKMQVN